MSRRAAQTRRRPGASSAQLAAGAGGQALPGQGRTPGAGHAPLERALRPPSGPGAVRLGEEGGWPFKSLVPVRGEGVPKVGQGRRWVSSAGKTTLVGWSWDGFLCAPSKTSPSILHRVARGRSGSRMRPPPSGRKWSLCAGAALLAPSSFFLPGIGSVLFGNREESGSAGWGRAVPW